MSEKVRVAVTGAAGQIGYSMLFRLASGEVFGPGVSVELSLLEIPAALKAAEGTAMELEDCAFPTLAKVECFDDAEKAFDGAHWALLVGSKPRGPGMERSDLIQGNGPIFQQQGRALQKADDKIRIITVGNPCNTNALIALKNAGDVPPERFTAMTALDENRAKAALAAKVGALAGEVENMVIWGNHSTTMYPDFENAMISGQRAEDVVRDRPWLENEFIPKVQKRGAEIIAARGKSSAASAASACLDQIMWMTGRKNKGKLFSAAVLSDGSCYDIPEGVMASVPLRYSDVGLEVVKTVVLSDFAKEKLASSIKELLKEREIVKDLL